MRSRKWVERTRITRDDSRLTKRLPASGVRKVAARAGDVVSDADGNRGIILGIARWGALVQFENGNEDLRAWWELQAVNVGPHPDDLI
jgi:hypothetical protein